MGRDHGTRWCDGPDGAQHAEPPAQLGPAPLVYVREALVCHHRASARGVRLGDAGRTRMSSDMLSVCQVELSQTLWLCDRVSLL